MNAHVWIDWTRDNPVIALLALIGTLRILFSLLSMLKWFSRTRSLKYYSMGESPWAVVTGASEGIGKEFALQLAAAGYSIVLMSRSRQKLDRVAQEIARSHPSVQTLVYPFDFSRPFDPSNYEALKVQLQSLNVCILVNNVGIAPDLPTSFMQDDPAFLRSMIQVNIASQLEMTRLIVPQMQAKKRGLVLNVGSMAGVVPCGLMATYR